MGDTLRLGRWQEALAGVECDALICDPPYGRRVHEGDRSKCGKGDSYRRVLDYRHFDPEDVAELVASWATRVRGWMVCMTSHDLIGAYEDAYADAGWLAFAPVPWVEPGKSVRLSGDGPASWTCYLMVARRRTAAAARWGALPGAYVIRSENRHGAAGAVGRYGGKPLALMEALVRDYSRPGDLVCDPCAGYGTTLAAALRQGRQAVGAEMDPETHARGLEYLDRNGRARDLFEAVEQVTAAQELPW
jgi:hypothetical protein